MSLESSKYLDRALEMARDKPQVERVEHGNFERSGAVLHPHARGWATVKSRITWERYASRPETRWR